MLLGLYRPAGAGQPAARLLWTSPPLLACASTIDTEFLPLYVAALPSAQPVFAAEAERPTIHVLVMVPSGIQHAVSPSLYLQHCDADFALVWVSRRTHPVPVAHLLKEGPGAGSQLCPQICE